MNNETKGHVHAQNMIEFGKDALTHKEPWKLWERSVDGVRWYPCNGNPTWVPEYKYRRVPRTININGHEVPEPLREIGSRVAVWLVALTSQDKVMLADTDYEWVRRIVIERGIAHATKEAAIAHAEALLSFTTTEAK